MQYECRAKLNQQIGICAEKEKSKQIINKFMYLQNVGKLC